MQETGTRINKYMSQCGYCSRREADRLIEKGEVWINGTLATMGTKVMPGDTVMVHHTTITPCQKEYLLAFHKPAGIVCTTSKIDKNNVIDYLNFPDRIYPVGRLDKDTEGLLLITNDGALAHDLLSPAKHVEKTYYAVIDGVVTEKDVNSFENGVDIGEEKLTKPGKLRILKSEPESKIELTITEGRFHQVKRMFEAVGKKVLYLKRISMGPLQLTDDLKPGEYRPLTEEEITALKIVNK